SPLYGSRQLRAHDLRQGCGQPRRLRQVGAGCRDVSGPVSLHTADCAVAVGPRAGAGGAAYSPSPDHLCPALSAPCSAGADLAEITDAATQRAAARPDARAPRQRRNLPLVVTPRPPATRTSPRHGTL